MKATKNVWTARTAIVVAAATAILMCAAATAFAGPEVVSGESYKFVGNASITQQLGDVDWAAIAEALEGAEEADDGPFPDMGGEGVVAEPEFPEDVPGDDGGDEGVQEQDVPVPDGGQEITSTVPSQETTPEVPSQETTPQVPQQSDGELPYTGGNGLGLAIVGAGLVLGGFALLGLRAKERQQ